MGISLDKRIETATVSLQKMAQKAPTDLGDVSAQVTAEIDFSASMEHLYRNGTVQEAVERALALSMTGLDDDGVVPVTFFDDGVYGTVEATQSTVDGLVQSFFDKHRMGGTHYAGPLKRALSGGKKKLLGRSQDDPTEPPFLHLFFTDGEPWDKPETEKILVAARTRPHFFQFIMLGTDRGARAYLDKLNNDLSGPGIDNVGVTIYERPEQLADEAFFDDIVSEFFPIWLVEARQAGITNK